MSWTAVQRWQSALGDVATFVMLTQVARRLEAAGGDRTACERVESLSLHALGRARSLVHEDLALVMSGYDAAQQVMVVIKALIKQVAPADKDDYDFWRQPSVRRALGEQS